MGQTDRQTDGQTDGRITGRVAALHNVPLPGGGQNNMLAGLCVAESNI